jgi:hypothetical protein
MSVPSNTDMARMPDTRRVTSVLSVVELDVAEDKTVLGVSYGDDLKLHTVPPTPYLQRRRLSRINLTEPSLP